MPWYDALEPADGATYPSPRLVFGERVARVRRSRNRDLLITNQRPTVLRSLHFLAQTSARRQLAMISGRRRSGDVDAVVRLEQERAPSELLCSWSNFTTTGFGERSNRTVCVVALHA